MHVAARGDLFGDVADLDQRGLVLLLRHVSARALHPFHDLLVAQLADRAVHRHARDAERARQRLFARDRLALLPGAALDLRQHMLLHPQVGGLAVVSGRGGQGGGTVRHRVSTRVQTDEVVLTGGIMAR
ncbi:hypothetical protein D9M69_689600 [compost metagenome]